MRIKKIQLKNGYKRFHDLTIDLGDNPKRIVALVGANGCGKSSVLDGMLFLNNSINAPIGNTGSRNYEYHSMDKKPNFSYSNIEIEFDAGLYQNVLRLKTNKEKTTPYFLSEVLIDITTISK